jgi:hypothetical protein
MVAAAALVAGCGDKAAESPSYDIGTGSFTTKTSKGPVNEEAVNNIISRKLGETDLAGKPMVKGLVITPEGDGKHVDIGISRTASCHPGQVIGIAVGAAQQIMSAVFRYDDVSSIGLTLYGTTEEAADSDKEAVKISVSKASAAKIDWFQFTDATVETMADSFWADADLYSNWKAYGGEEITDEQQRASANSAAAPAPSS